MQKKEGERFIFSIKARNKYQKNHKLNAYYNLGSDAYRKAATAEQEYCAEPHWMAIQFDQFTFSIYWGPLEELNGKNAIPLAQCAEGKIGTCLAKDRRHYFDFGFFGNAKDE